MRHINYLAVLFVVVIHQLIGTLWYSPIVFGNKWLTYIGKSVEEIREIGASPYLIAIVGSLIVCVVMSILIQKLNINTAFEGIKLALFVWFGFVFTTVYVHYSFAGNGLGLVWIDSLHILVNLVIAGGFLAVWKKS